MSHQTFCCSMVHFIFREHFQSRENDASNFRYDLPPFFKYKFFKEINLSLPGMRSATVKLEAKKQFTTSLLLVTEQERYEQQMSPRLRRRSWKVLHQALSLRVKKSHIHNVFVIVLKKNYFISRCKLNKTIFIRCISRGGSCLVEVSNAADWVWIWIRI